MSENRPIDAPSRRQQRLQDVFESVCGTSVIHEHQEEQRHHPDDDQVDAPVGIESYLDENIRSDGLDDAIELPELKQE